MTKRTICNWLEFKNASMEEHYRQWYASRSASVANLTCVLLMSLWTVICGLLLVCDYVQNRIILSVVQLIPIAFAVYLHRARATRRAPRVNFVVAAVYMPITILCWLGFRAGCVSSHDTSLTRYVQLAYTGDVAFLFTFAWFVATHVVLETTLRWRLLLSVMIMGPFYHALFAIRKTYTPDDGVAEWTWTPALIFNALIFCSYTMDLSERHSFQTRQTLSLVLGSARGRSAFVASQALSIMVPTFVAERMLNDKRIHPRVPPPRRLRRYLRLRTLSSAALHNSWVAPSLAARG